jgi:CPA2 family monovalent cation:H+ antiporter-2
MLHDTDLIRTLTAGLVAAFAIALVSVRLRVPPIVGYLIAGIAIGPFTPGYEGDTEIAPQLAEIGVILLMFGVGIHFSIKDLLSVRAIAIPGADRCRDCAGRRYKYVLGLEFRRRSGLRAGDLRR